MAPLLISCKHFSQQVVKKSFPKREQNAKALNNHGGKYGENSVDNVKSTQASAQILALQALTFVTERPELVEVFLAQTGVYPNDLPQLARQPLFLGAVLDFLMEDDQRVIDFCAAQGLALTSVQTARNALPGAQHHHWT